VIVLALYALAFFLCIVLALKFAPILRIFFIEKKNSRKFNKAATIDTLTEIPATVKPELKKM
jgi:hypothetical protein